MNTVKSFLALASLYLTLVGSAFASTTELLYVQQGQNVITYSVNTKTAVTKKLGSLATAYTGAQSMIIRRSGSFLYLLGFSPAIEYFTVYSLTAAGVPNPKPVQTLTVKPALSQFLIHPNGTIAYSMFSWQEVVNGNVEYASDVVMFTVNPKTGKLTNTTKVVANFPLNDSWSTAMYGMSSKGTKLYTGAAYVGPFHNAGIVYDYFTVSTKTGVLGKPVQFWFDNQWDEYDTSVFSDALIAQVHNGVSGNEIGISSNSASPVTLISCFANNLSVCGDNIGPSLWMHPSGAYVFVADQTTSEVPILYISLPLQQLEASGASIPGYPSDVKFSPDGLLVYAVEGSEILVYGFNPHSGLLTAKTTINAPGVLSILPWQ